MCTAYQLYYGVIVINDSVRKSYGNQCARQHEGARQRDAGVRVSPELLEQSHRIVDQR